MLNNSLVQILLLLATAVAVVFSFQRLKIPTSLGYLLVGLILGPHTIGPSLHTEPIQALAEFGIVFLLFTVGLNYSLPQIHALRNTVLGLGSAQVALTTAVVGALVYFVLGLPAAAAFVVGAVFAQSSTTVISNQLLAQGEENSRHGRLGVALSVFQDVTAVPLLILIPAFGVAATGFSSVAFDIVLAIGKAVLAFLAVVILGRWFLRPLFHYVAKQQSPELFTLTVLLVSLAAGWATSLLGLSMAFGAFLAGMMLGETEFRHQVEATVRPFRDVLLGLFFIGVGMLIDPSALPAIWHWVLLGTFVLLLSKILLVMLIVRWSGIDPLTAWRTALILAVGGEFGFALLSIALGDNAIDAYSGQIVLYAVLLSIITAPFLIRYNHPIAAWLAAATPDIKANTPGDIPEAIGHQENHVIICGYGRMGQSVGNFLEEEKISFVALDLDAVRVGQAHLAGEPVFYGDATDDGMLDAVGLRSARLLVISHNDIAAARRILQHVRGVRPDLPIMVRTIDETHVEELYKAGATEVIPETLEASLMVASNALLLLGTPLTRVVRKMREQRNSRYRLLREAFTGYPGFSSTAEDRQDRLRSVPLPAAARSVGKPVSEVIPEGIVLTALVRQGERHLTPAADTVLAADDILVLFGAPEDIERVERTLLQ